jgi:hypothetical protein
MIELIRISRSQCHMQKVRMMTSTKNFSKNEQLSFGVYFLLTAVTAAPVWLAIQAYLEALHTHLDEAAATAATFCFFAGVFLGRYFGLLWTANKNRSPMAF